MKVAHNALEGVAWAKANPVIDLTINLHVFSRVFNINNYYGLHIGSNRYKPLSLAVKAIISKQIVGI